MSSPTIVRNSLGLGGSPLIPRAVKAFALPYIGLSIVNRTYWYTNLVRADERIKEMRASERLPKFEFKGSLSAMHTMGRKAIIWSLEKPVLSSAIIALAFIYLPRLGTDK